MDREEINDLISNGIGALVGALAGLKGGQVGFVVGGAVVGGIIPSVWDVVSRRIKGNGVLILEDDQTWLSQHKEYLGRAGLKVYDTQIASDAIKIFRKNKSVRFAVIDEVLYEPGTEILQNDSGMDVARAIHEYARDSGRKVIVYLVTNAVQEEVEGKILVDPEKVNIFEEPGIIHKVIPKRLIELSQGVNYRKIIRDMKRS